MLRRAVPLCATLLLAVSIDASAGNTSTNTSNNSSTNTSSDPWSSNSSSNDSDNESGRDGRIDDYRRSVVIDVRSDRGVRFIRREIDETYRTEAGSWRRIERERRIRVEDDDD